MADAPTISSADPLAIPLGLQPEFERIVVRLCATSPEFFARIGRLILPELLGCDEAKLALTAVRQLCKDSAGQRHPASTVLVAQKVFEWSSSDGVTRIESARAVDQYLRVDPTTLPAESGVVELLMPLMKRQLRQIVARYASQAVMPLDAEKNLKRLKQSIELLEALDTSAPRADEKDEFGPDMFGSLAAYEAKLTYLPTGIIELDALLCGGIQTGLLGCIMGKSNAGKSMMACQLFCAALRANMFPIYASLEHSKRKVFARAKANLTHIPTLAITGNPEQEAEADRRFRWLTVNKKISAGFIKKFQGGTTTILDIVKWVQKIEAKVGRRAHLLLIDADEGLAHPSEKDIGDYKGYQLSYQHAIHEAQGPDPDEHPELMRAVVFMSQLKVGATRTASNKPKIADHEDGADSSKKGKMVDWAATLNIREEDLRKELIINLSKNRDGPTGMTSQMPTNYECGQMVTMNDPWPWLRDPKGWDRGVYEQANFEHLGVL